MKIKKLELTGEFSSENGYGEGTEIQFGYRDLKTGKIKITNTVKTKKYHSQENLNGKTYSLYSFTINDFYYYEYGVEPIVIYNGKFMRFEIKKEDMIEGTQTAVKELDIFDMKNQKEKTDNYANYIENSKVEIQDDPIVSHYIYGGYWGFFDEKEMNGIEGPESYGNQSEFGNGIYHQGYDFINIKNIERMKKEGKSFQEIYNFVFEEVDASSILKEHGFSEKEISLIKDNGLLNYIDKVQEKIKPDEILELEEYLGKFDKKGNYLGEKQNEGKTSSDLMKKELGTFVIKENKNEEVKTGELNAVEVIVFIFLFIIIIGIGIVYFLKKKNNENKNNENT